MFIFDELLTASARALKDFITFIYHRCKSVYLSFKRYLWVLQGKFESHSAFVDKAYGYIDDVEEFELELATAYNLAAEEEVAALAELRRLTAPGLVQHRPINLVGEPVLQEGEVTGLETDDQEPAEELVAESWPTPCIPPGIYTEVLTGRGFLGPVDGEALPPVKIAGRTQYVVPVEVLCAATRKAHAAVVARHETVAEVLTVYEEKKGKNYFGKFFNTVAGRMAAVTDAAARREKTEILAAELGRRVELSEDLRDFYPLCNTFQIPTGKIIKVAGKKDDEDEEVEETVLQRSIKEECRGDAARWIRHYVRMKNPLLSADDVSSATITRHVELFAKQMDLNLASSTFLRNVALRMVPLPTRTDFDIAMTVHCPAARQLRSDLCAVTSSVF